MANLNPVQMEKYLKGVKYPATKAELVSHAQQNGADKQVCEQLERLPEQQYEHATDVSRAISSIERRSAH